jgi:hypothetical protein
VRASLSPEQPCANCTAQRRRLWPLDSIDGFSKGVLRFIHEIKRAR